MDQVAGKASDYFVVSAFLNCARGSTPDCRVFKRIVAKSKCIAAPRYRLAGGELKERPPPCVHKEAAAFCYEETWLTFMQVYLRDFWNFTFRSTESASRCGHSFPASGCLSTRWLSRTMKKSSSPTSTASTTHIGR